MLILLAPGDEVPANVTWPAFQSRYTHTSAADLGSGWVGLRVRVRVRARSWPVKRHVAHLSIQVHIHTLTESVVGVRVCGWG